MGNYQYKCGFCGAILGDDIGSRCPQIKCQNMQDEAKAASKEMLGSPLYEREDEADVRNGFIKGYYFAKMKI